MDAADPAPEVEVLTNYDDYYKEDYDDDGGAAASGSAASHITIDPHNPMHQALMNPMTTAQMYSFTGPRRTASGLIVTSQMVRWLFNLLTTGNFMHPDPDDGKLMRSLEEKLLPVYRMPFVSEPESDWIASGIPIGDYTTSHKFTYTPGGGNKITIRDEIARAAVCHNLLDRPILFLVTTNIPHATIYILLGGKLYSFGYGYYGHVGPIIPGAIYSVDHLIMEDNHEARITWVGILDKETLARMNTKFASVTQIIFSVKCNKDGENIVSTQSTLMIPDEYSLEGAKDVTHNYYDCLKWAMDVLGILQDDYWNLFFRSQIDESYMFHLIDCMRNGNTREFLKTLRIANYKVYTPEQIRQFDEKYHITEAEKFGIQWSIQQDMFKSQESQRMQQAAAAFRGGRRIKKFRSCNKGNRKCKRQTRNNKPRNNKTKKTRNNKTRMSRKMRK